MFQQSLAIACGRNEREKFNENAFHIIDFQDKKTTGGKRGWRGERGRERKRKEREREREREKERERERETERERERREKRGWSADVVDADKLKT